MVEEAAVAVGVNLASTAVCTATSLGRTKTQRLVREHSIDKELDDLNTEFGNSLEAAIEEIDAGSETGELTGITDDWEEIAREVHGLSTDETDTEESIDDASATQDRLAFASEEDAIEALAEAIASVQGFDLSKTPQLERELKEALTVAYRESLETFIDRIAGTELADALLVEAQLTELDELRSVLTRLERLEEKFATPRHYDLTDVAEEGLAAADPLALTGPDLEFVDRPDLAGHYDDRRCLLVGPGGSGKSRALADMVENYEREVRYVVRPREAFNDREDFRRLRREGFDDDVLLVWDDVHEVVPEQDNLLFRQTITKLEASLPEDTSVHVLAAARVEGLDNFSGDPRKSHGGDFWADFEVVELEPLTADVLAGIFQRALENSEVDATDDVQEQFVRKALETDPSPLYVTSVVETAGDRLTETNIEEVPADALGIWAEQYEEIYHQRSDWVDEEHRYVLWTFKILNEIRIPPYHSLVEGVYEEVLGRDVTTLGPPLEELETRQWFVELETDEGAVYYEMHDVKAEAVDESVDRWVRELSEFFRESLDWYLPNDVDGLERICHGQFAVYAGATDARRGPQTAEKHYLEIIDEEGLYLDDGVTHYNYANLLKNELDRPKEAEDHYLQAIDIDPELAEAHINYAHLLTNELDRPEAAQKHLETSVRLWIDRGIVENALHDLCTLVVVCQRLDDDKAVVESCNRALSLLPEIDEKQPKSRCWFRGQKALADDDTETTSLYQFALENVRAFEPSLATKLFEMAWNRRNDHEEETVELSAARAAGVALAAHAELFDDLDGPSADEILAELDPKNLHEPEVILYEQLTGGTPETNTEDLQPRAEEYREAGEELDALEAEAFRILLGELE